MALVQTRDETSMEEAKRHKICNWIRSREGRLLNLQEEVSLLLARQTRCLSRLLSHCGDSLNRYTWWMMVLAISRHAGPTKEATIFTKVDLILDAADSDRT